MILAQVRDFKMFLDGKDDVMTPEILAYNCHEPAETELILSHVQVGMTFLDIGANVGYFSLLASKKLTAQGKIYAFEPEPRNYAVLTKNITLNSAFNVMPVSKALSNHKGFSSFFLDQGNFGAHTFSALNIQTRNETSIQVEVTTLDDVVREMGIHVDFIKMDVQGAEGLVLEKAEETLKRHRPKILMEFWPEGLRNLKTDPLALLHQLEKDYAITLVEGNGTLLAKNPDEILRIAKQRTYVNLFCIPKSAVP